MGVPENALHLGPPFRSSIRLSSVHLAPFRSLRTGAFVRSWRRAVLSDYCLPHSGFFLFKILNYILALLWQWLAVSAPASANVIVFVSDFASDQ